MKPPSPPAPANSNYQRWLGSAYGPRRPATRNRFSAFGIAKKAHAAMEKAVQLDPQSADALSDLGEYCISAPGIVGGGVDKANALAQRLLAVDAPRGHGLLARIAEKQNNLALAEKEFTASAAGDHAAAGFVDLAAYYKRHGSKAQVMSAIRSAVAADKSRSYSTSDAAGILIEASLDAKMAQQLYRSYLSGPSRSENAPACRVYTELRPLARGYQAMQLEPKVPMRSRARALSQRTTLPRKRRQPNDFRFVILTLSLRRGRICLLPSCAE